MKIKARSICEWLVIPVIGLLCIQPDAYAARTSPGISINDMTVTEGESEYAIFTVSIDSSPSSRRPVSVNVSTRDGTASAGSDYESSGETLVFERGGPRSQQFSVAITNDDTREGDETYTVELSGATNGRLIDAIGAGTILDDEALRNQPPTCRIDSPADSTALPVGGTIDFSATVSDPDGDTVSIAWQFGGGTPANSSLEDPGSVSFDTAGDYTVTLDADDSRGGQCARQSRAVTVTENEVAAVSINSTSASGWNTRGFSPVPERPQVLGGNYSVFAVNDLGMHCVDLDGRIANILPPFQVLLGQVIQKGVRPTLNPAGVSLSYSAASNPLDPVLASGAAPTGIAADGTLYKTNFWQGIPRGSYDAFYPPVVTPLSTDRFR